MPKSRAEVSISANIERCWKFILDLKNIGLCLGILDEAKDIEDGSTLWVLKTQQATITRTKSVKASIKFKDPYRRIEWRALGENLSIDGSVELESMAKDKTKAIVELEIEIKGPLGIILNPMISAMINSRVETFSENIKNKLES
ncbi:MAG: SRPBCC family protein [Candidatus Bathyarchaeia archaeon]